MKKLLKTVSANLFLVTPESQVSRFVSGRGMLNRMTRIALQFMALQFNLRPALRRSMRSADGWINFSVGFRVENAAVAQTIVFNNGRARVVNHIPRDVDVTLWFADGGILKEMARSTPNEMLNLILKNRMVLDGNLTCLQVFNYFVSLLMGPVHRKMLARAHRSDIRSRKATYGDARETFSRELRARREYRMQGDAAADPGVKYLTDSYLSTYSLADFPRLKQFREIHFETLPEVCAERPRLMTAWYRQHGFETDMHGRPWFPELRQAMAFHHLMTHRRPIIRENDLLAGTTTTKTVGATVFPDGQGTMFWGELNASGHRVLCPYICDPDTAQVLHHEVFPFWMHRTFREYVREKYNYPVCQKIDERFVAYFVWKSVGVSHTIPNFRRLLEKGISGILADIQERRESGGFVSEQRDTLDAMAICLEGVVQYAHNLSAHAEMLAGGESDPRRIKELNRLAEICRKVPAAPPETLDEAVNAVWIVWTALHLENTNTGLSLGRLDQLFQPFFENDMRRCASPQEKTVCIETAIELIGCLFMRLTDHVPLLPDIGNYLFGGASSTQAITIGGVTPEGDDAVNDMTYIFLKVTEMLAVRDANINARYHVEINSDAYLKRLCEVNVITAATPIMQGDAAVFSALAQHGYPETAIRDWAATGCVEPTLQGRHFSHTATILLNMVAAMEMALNNGTHPVMRWDPGPGTGCIEKGDFQDFESFFNAWACQQRFIIEQAVMLNNYLGEAHRQLRPTPLLSALIDGCIENGRDVLKGGAMFNSGGTSNIGLADVVDSLLVIKKLVFDDQRVSFERLKRAVDSDFADDPILLGIIRKDVPLFGSGDKAAIAMANRVAAVVHNAYGCHTLYRGGPYTAGFWSMSQHVAYGSLSGTLPSGRRAGKAFTPGLTPSPQASNNFLNNISSVACLDPHNLDNNLAFNVKLIPGPNDTREQIVDRMHAYAKTYFKMGGMQMQFNVVSSETLKDAMAHPENYRDLMVRISGYNAYFVTLNQDIQMELIERTAYGL